MRTHTPDPQRRVLRVLVAAQALGGVGQAAGAAAAGLLAAGIAGPSSAGLPLAAIVLGSAVAALPLSSLAARTGRRTGLSAALLAGAAGAAVVVAAGALASLPLLLAGSAVFGAGNAALMLARYAATDLSPLELRGRAIATVVVATSAGAVAGPNLLGPAGDAVAGMGLPPLTGSFAVSSVAYLGAALVLLAFLRPDPLLLAMGAGGPPPPRRRVAAALRVLMRTPRGLAGLSVLATANLVMVALMAVAPVHLHAHGHDLDTIGLVVSLHLAAMFAPAPLTGWLTDRLGGPAVALGSAGLLTGAGLVAAVGSTQPVSAAAGLVLLGIGWNAALVAGSTMLTAGLRPAERPHAEGVGDIGMGLAAAGAGVAAGPVASGSYAILAAACAVVPVLAIGIPAAMGDRPHGQRLGRLARSRVAS